MCDHIYEKSIVAYMLKVELVSIIMPTYNVGALVIETVSTVIEQSYTNWELLVVDDCSTDNTRELLANLAKQDPRIKCLFSEKNVGAGGSRNIGLSKAQGKYIAFLDSDDLWLPDKLESQIAFMKENSAPICHTSFSFIDENGHPRKGAVHVSPLVKLEDNLKNTEIGTSTAMIDRTIVGSDFRFSHLRARQDLKLWIELLGKGFTSYGLEKVLVKYRVRSGSVSSNKWKMLYVTFKVYMSTRQLSFTKRVYCYLNYVANAIKKRS